jgi:hypothetical protein
VKLISRLADEEPINSHRKGTYLRILKVFLTQKGKPIKQNQNDIAILMANEEKGSILRMFKAETQEEIKSLIEGMVGFKTPDEESGSIDLTVPVELFNMSCCLDLFATCCLGKNEVAESKCIVPVLDVKAALELIKILEFCWPVKENLVQYVQHCLLSSGQNDYHDNKENTKAIWSLIYSLLNDMDYGLLKSEDEYRTYRFRFPNGSTQSFDHLSKQYIYMAIIPCLKTFMSRQLPKIDDKCDLILRKCCESVVTANKFDVSTEFKEQCRKFCQYVYG